MTHLKSIVRDLDHTASVRLVCQALSWALGVTDKLVPALTELTGPRGSSSGRRHCGFGTL